LTGNPWALNITVVWLDNHSFGLGKPNANACMPPVAQWFVLVGEVNPQLRYVPYPSLSLRH